MMKDFAMHIMDIAQNSISAGATEIELLIGESASTDRLIMRIRDNGKGIPADMIGKVTDPYVTSRTTRKVGLGLPLLKQHADSTGGYLSVESASGKGTTVTAVFGLSHLDRQPLGDIAGTVVLLAAANPALRFIYRHTTPVGTYRFDTAEVNEMLEGMSISEAPVIRFLKEMINENLKEIKISG
ncbi:ATP-binding protein [Lentimicrobium sp.]|uniref:ATP-binding protein n=1 Tax=Lentimicrobium sp. TaxID=2034841 RepID=UPI00345EF4C6